MRKIVYKARRQRKLYKIGLLQAKILENQAAAGENFTKLGRRRVSQKKNYRPHLGL